MINTQHFEEVQDKYTWNNINLIGNKIKIIQDQISNLEVANFMVYGRLARADCDKYKNKVASLFTSCKKTEIVKPPIIKQNNTDPYFGLSIEEIKLAKEFEKILIKEENVRKPKEEKAKKLWGIVEAQIKQEKETAKQANKLGMPPPPPKYSAKQIATIQKYLPHHYPQLAGIDKANCMRSLNQILTLNNQAIVAGREAQMLPYRQDDAQRYSKESADILANYNKICINKTG